MFASALFFDAHLLCVYFDPGIAAPVVFVEAGDNISSMATEVAGAAAAAAGAAAAAAGSSTGDLESQICKVADKIASVESETESVKQALRSKQDYLGMTGEKLTDYLRGLMKEKEQLRDEKAKLMERQQVTGEARVGSHGTRFGVKGLCC